MNTPRVVDAFPGLNEISLAKFRIQYLESIVDKVIIGESSLTHSGKTKPLFFSNWLSDSNFRDRVEVILIPLRDNQSAWEREIFTREYISKYLLDCYPNSFFILSDLDEIPSIDQVRNAISLGGIFHFSSPTSYRRANWVLSDSHGSWNRGVLGMVSELSLHNNGARFSQLKLVSGEPGAHFSYLGHGGGELTAKIKAFAHKELDINVWSDGVLLRFCDFYKLDHLGRGRSKGFGLLNIVSADSRSIINEMARMYPNWYELSNTDTSRAKRIMASIWLTSYLGTGPVSRLKRILFPPNIYFSPRSEIIFFTAFIEIGLTCFCYFRRFSRQVKQRLGF